MALMCEAVKHLFVDVMLSNCCHYLLKARSFNF